MVFNERKELKEPPLKVPGPVEVIVPVIAVLAFNAIVSYKVTIFV